VDDERVAVGPRARRELGPILPEAPLRFSITTGCPRLSDKRGATTRATASTLPPGGKATISRTGLAG